VNALGPAIVFALIALPPIDSIDVESPVGTDTKPGQVSPLASGPMGLDVFRQFVER
jgi:hypothetical protein